MEIRQALKEQYHASLEMLAECVEKCPENVWLEGKHPRTYWRIVGHAAFFTHCYLMQGEEAFNVSARGWPLAVRELLSVSGAQPVEIEPYDLPEGASPLSRQDTLEWIGNIRGLVDGTVDSLDLEIDETGFSWYPGMSKLSHEIMNLRHIHGHIGQLSELLMSHDIDTKWRARGYATT
jgi:hypothetical protein